MMVKKSIKSIMLIICRRASAAALAVFAAAIVLSAVPSYAASTGDDSAKLPGREAHMVEVAGSLYCCFAQNSVVLTADQIAGMTDEELTYTILDLAGFYMKKTNCKKPEHKVINVDSWLNAKGDFVLNDADIAALRAAVPEDGYPVKMYMDLGITTEPVFINEDEADDNSDDSTSEEPEPIQVYSTFKRTGPAILFVVVATETDAAYGEDICKEDKVPEKKVKIPRAPAVSKKSDMLPEYRKISMVDRSGGPLEETLKDGTPVTLEWIEPKKHIADDKDKYLFGFIPRNAAAAILCAAAAAVIAGVVIAKKRRDREQ